MSLKGLLGLRPRDAFCLLRAKVSTIWDRADVAIRCQNGNLAHIAVYSELTLGPEVDTNTCHLKPLCRFGLAGLAFSKRDHFLNLYGIVFVFPYSSTRAPEHFDLPNLDLV